LKCKNNSFYRDIQYLFSVDLINVVDRFFEVPRFAVVVLK
jgi:hypothetical protein